MNPIENMQQASQCVEQLMAGVSADQMDAKTPCSQWQVRELMNHMVGGAHMFAAARKGGAVPSPGSEMPDMLGDDPSGSYRQAADELVRAYQGEGALEQPVQMPFGEMPGAAALSLIFADHLTHAWDLARATGQSAQVDDSLAEAARGVWQMGIQPEMRDGDLFGPELQAPEGASAWDRLAAFTGREV